MKCGSKKKPKKFAAGGETKKYTEGGWSTSVSFDPEDAKRRAEQWAKDHPPKAKAAPKPAAKPAPKSFSDSGSSPLPKVSAPKLDASKYSASGPTRQRYVPTAFEGAKQAKNALTFDEPAPRSGKMKPAKTGEGWAWLKKKLSDRGAYAKYAKGGKVRGDGCASKGKTKGRMC